MKEFKFRIFDKKNKKILEVDTLFINEGMFKPVGGDEYSVWNYDTEYYSNPMQYTGLKDKNGVEIYEGDIAKVLVAYTDYDGCEYKRPSRVYDHKTKYVNIAVSFESGTFILDTDYTDSLGHTLWLWTQEDVEVIGNIYENKELLNTKG